MAFDPPTEVTVGSVLTADKYNQEVVENVSVLHDRDGLIAIETKTISAATTLSFDSCFTSDFRNYRVEITAEGTGNQGINIRLRAGTTDNTSNNYQYRRHGVVASASFTDAAATTSSFANLISANPLAAGSASIDIFQPQATARTGISGTSLQQQSTDLFIIHYGGLMTVTTSYDGFTLLSGANWSGQATVYAYGEG